MLTFPPENDREQVDGGRNSAPAFPIQVMRTELNGTLLVRFSEWKECFRLSDFWGGGQREKLVRKRKEHTKMENKEETSQPALNKRKSKM